MGVLISKGGRDISEADALMHVGGYLLAVCMQPSRTCSLAHATHHQRLSKSRVVYRKQLDMTARDLQDIAKEKRLPWSTAKGFDTFCPISKMVKKSLVPDPQNVELKLTINGVVKQHGHTKDMIFSVARQIASFSKVMTLQPGDLILTGTPAGVGPVQIGETMEATMTSNGKILATLSVPVIARPPPLLRQ
jgi:acylpyruvate hydrolase